MNVGGTLKKIFSLFKLEIGKHVPEILSGAAVAGTFATAGLAVYGTPEALRRIDARKKELGVEKLTVKETIKTAWKCYIPAAISGGTTTACIIASNVESNKKLAVMASAVAMSEQALQDYAAKVTEIFGDDADTKVRKSLEEDHRPVPATAMVFTGKNVTLCKDELTGQYFFSDPGTIKNVIGQLNERLYSRDSVSENEYCIALGIPPVEGGDDIEWNVQDGCITPSYESELQKDTDLPCFVIAFTPTRKPGWRRVY